MKEKGFTLIELLAVIIILAVIAVIAVPVVTDLIATSRISAAEESTRAILRSAKIYYGNEEIKNHSFNGATFICNGTSCTETTTNDVLKFEGTVPTSGTIEITAEGEAIIIDILEYDNGSIYVGYDKNNNNKILGSKTEEDVVGSYLPNSLSDYDYILGGANFIRSGCDYPISVPEEYILLTNYKGTSTTVNIPSTYKVNGQTYKVLIYSDDDWCGGGSFYGNEAVEYINMASGVTAAKYDEELVYNSMNYMFAYMTNLKGVTGIPNSVIYMDGTFQGCTSLTSAPTIPSSVTNMGHTFQGCTSLTEAPVIPSSVTSMAGTFYGCTSLTKAPTIPNSVIYMNGTFQGCTSLTEAPVIPDSVTNMSFTFSGCTSLTEAPTIPFSVTNMGATFYGCTSLTSAPTIPSSVTNMDYTFRGCTSLTGTIRVNAQGITNATNTFTNTVNAIKVQVKSGSATYTKFSNSAFPSNVTIETY